MKQNEESTYRAFHCRCCRPGGDGSVHANVMAIMLIPASPGTNCDCHRKGTHKPLGVRK